MSELQAASLFPLEFFKTHMRPLAHIHRMLLSRHWHLSLSFSDNWVSLALAICPGEIYMLAHKKSIVCCVDQLHALCSGACSCIPYTWSLLPLGAIHSHTRNRIKTKPAHKCIRNCNSRSWASPAQGNVPIVAH
jgi:hypothetical protein